MNIFDELGAGELNRGPRTVYVVSGGEPYETMSPRASFTDESSAQIHADELRVLYPDEVFEVNPLPLLDLPPTHEKLWENYVWRRTDDGSITAWTEGDARQITVWDYEDFDWPEILPCARITHDSNVGYSPWQKITGYGRSAIEATEVAARLAMSEWGYNPLADSDDDGEARKWAMSQVITGYAALSVFGKDEQSE